MFECIYEDEYAHLKQKIVILNREIAKEENHITNTDDFLNVIGKYTDMKNLTREMIIAFIQHIDVYHVEDRSGEKFQRIRIHYNFVGPVLLPEREGLPKPQIKMCMKKGVATNYSQSQTA